MFIWKFCQPYLTIPTFFSPKIPRNKTTADLLCSVLMLQQLNEYYREFSEISAALGIPGHHNDLAK